MKKWSADLEGEGWVRARDEWMRRAVLGAPYIFRDGSSKILGTSLRLDDSGGLVMKTDDGEITVYSGEIEEAIQDSRFKIQD